MMRIWTPAGTAGVGALVRALLVGVVRTLDLGAAPAAERFRTLAA